LEEGVVQAVGRRANIRRSWPGYRAPKLRLVSFL